MRNTKVGRTFAWTAQYYGLVCNCRPIPWLAPKTRPSYCTLPWTAPPRSPDPPTQLPTRSREHASGRDGRDERDGRDGGRPLRGRSGRDGRDWRAGRPGGQAGGTHRRPASTVEGKPGSWKAAAPSGPARRPVSDSGRRAAYGINCKPGNWMAAALTKGLVTNQMRLRSHSRTTLATGWQHLPPKA